MTPVTGILWLTWAALLFGGFALGRAPSPGKNRIPTPARMGSSAVLVVAAVVFALYAPGSLPLALTALGMALGLLGDLFMARLIVKSERFVFGGIAAFGLCHVAYIIALFAAGDALGATDALPRWGALIAAWVFGLVMWFIVIWRPAKERGALHGAALVYALLLASTLGAAAGLSLQRPAFWPVALGALLFLISDLILAAQLFNGLRFRLINETVWLTYGPGQMLIVFGMGLALYSM
ncbi:MAG: lysoplasmalogenase [Anaerolineae bacterium]|nr:lysoplasmalogenase [Anaerolineae bacterium]